jgi:hypothetical protein
MKRHRMINIETDNEISAVIPARYIGLEKGIVMSETRFPAVTIYSPAADLSESRIIPLFSEYYEYRYEWPAAASQIRESTEVLKA